MNEEQFRKLKPGDRVRWRRFIFTIAMIEKDEAGTRVIIDKNFAPIKVDDHFVKDLEVVAIGEVMDNGDVIDPATGEITYEEMRQVEPKAKHMIRIDLVISGIDPETKGWEFMEQTIEEAIEQYGGEVTEYNVINQ